MIGEATHQMAILAALAGGACQTVEEIAGAAGLSRHDCAKAAGRLVMRDLIERMEVGCYRITDDGRCQWSSGKPIRSGPRRKHTGNRRPRETFRQKLWTAMRLSQRFTVPQILTIAGHRNDSAETGNAHRYIRKLVAHGYLALLPGLAAGSAPTSPGFKVYRIVRDTGPIAPSVRETSVYDHNIGEVMPCRSSTTTP